MLMLTNKHHKTEAEKHLDQLHGVSNVHVYHKIEIKEKEVPRKHRKYKGRVPNVASGLDNIVSLALGGPTFDACKRKLYLVVKKYQDRPSRGKAVSVGCIATPAPTLPSLREKVDHLLALDENTEGRDEDEKFVRRTIKPQVMGLTWVLLLNDYKGIGEGIDGKFWSSSQLLSGFYGLQVWISHLMLEEDGKWYRRTQVIASGIRFRWRKIATSGDLDWDTRIMESGLSSIALSLSQSFLGHATRAWLEEHSHLTSQHADLKTQYESDLKSWNASARQQSTLSRSDSTNSDKTRTSLVGQPSEHKNQGQRLKKPRKPSKYPGLRRVLRAARDDRSTMQGSGYLSSECQPSEESLLTKLIFEAIDANTTQRSVPDSVPDQSNAPPSGTG
jgi:hypothetical protein